MNSESRLEAMAALLIDAHRRHRLIDVAGPPPGNAQAAYRIQDIVAQTLWRDEVAAWKTGGDGRTEPIAAPIPGEKLHESPFAVSAGSFHFIGIEAELAYRLKTDLPPRDRAYDEVDMAAAIASVHAAIELCDSRLREWHTADPLWKLADNQMNAALVVGGGLGEWRSIAPRSIGVTLEVDGKTVKEAVGSHPLGDPLALLPFLANHCAARCGGLRARDVVTTGSWTGMILVEADAEVVVRFTTIGEARVRFSR